MIVRVAARGDGVTADGRHVPLAAPGDTLHADGTLGAGRHRREPPCRHFPLCGGCQLQHLDDESYSAFIVNRITSALDAQDLTTKIRAPILSPPRTRRRATLHAEGKGDRVRLGFASARSHDIVDIAECHILAPELFALIAPLRKLLQRLRFRGRGDIHLALIDQGVDCLVTSFSPESLEAAEAVTAFAKENGIARFSFHRGMSVETRWEPDPVSVTLGGLPVSYPPTAFLQATREGEAALVAAVREAMGDAGITADLFAGLGTFALALPGRVYAAEGARDELLALKAAASTGGRAVFGEHRDLYRRPLTVTELNRFDAVVIDPPRAGAREQAAALAACQAKAIAYVSCNPSSFARDARMLVEGGWQLDWVCPVGQFLWSTHVELAARFSR